MYAPNKNTPMSRAAPHEAVKKTTTKILNGDILLWAIYQYSPGIFLSGMFLRLRPTTVTI